MKRGFWHRTLPALLIFLCQALGAAEPSRQLAFLRAAPSTENKSQPQTKNRPVPEVSSHEALRSLDAGSFYDPTNPDLKYLQRYAEGVANLPLDANGFPDWMRALKEAKIRPSAGMNHDATMNILDLDVIMKNTKEMPFVRFPHYQHTLWLDCSNCHPAPFEARSASTTIRMADIFRGKYCGICHDRVAFITFFSCQRCHNVQQPGGIILPK